jgi:DNA-binding NarL/FixJ family response regulator
MTDSAAAAGPLRVLLVDTDDRVRESLAGLIRIGHRCLVVGTAGTVEDALTLARDSAPDVVVVDPRMPDPERGRAFIAQIRDASPTSRILVLVWPDGTDETWGADAYARKTFRSHELIDAVIATSRSSVA